MMITAESLKRLDPQVAHRPEPTLQTICPRELARLLDCGRAVVIDVREPAEFHARHIPGAISLPLSVFDPASLPRDDERTAVLCCGTGKRSEIAAKALLAGGAHRAAHLGGGLAAWSAEGLCVATT